MDKNNTIIKIIGTLAIISFLLPALSAYGAEEGETARMIRRITPPLYVIEKKEEEKKKDSWYLDTFYETSGILQGNKTGRWDELDTLFGYIHQNVQGYLSFSQLERFDVKDYTVNFGTYITLKDSYVHLEGGFGWDISYIYQFQSIAEYGHKLYKTLFWQMGYAYRDYLSNDTHLVYPGLIYYFGDSYMSATYGASFIESRDTASFGTVKGDFAITDFLRWTAGVAFGQRLYDIFELDAAQENGYILFTGLTVKIYKGIVGKVGYSYGTEDPKFVKRSINFDLTVKF